MRAGRQRGGFCGGDGGGPGLEVMGYGLGEGDGSWKVGGKVSGRGGGGWRESYIVVVIIYTYVNLKWTWYIVWGG